MVTRARNSASRARVVSRVRRIGRGSNGVRIVRIVLKVDRATFAVRRGRKRARTARFSTRRRRFVVFDGWLSDLGVGRHSKRWMEGTSNGWRGRERERWEKERFFLGEWGMLHGTREGLCVILSNRMPHVIPLLSASILSTHRLQGRLPRLHPVPPFQSKNIGHRGHR